MVLAMPILAPQLSRAGSYRHTYTMSVPVYVITERNLPGYASSKPSIQNTSLAESLHAGIVRVPVRLKTARVLDLSSLKVWGCSPQDNQSSKTLSRYSIASQLKNSPSDEINLCSGHFDFQNELKDFVNDLQKEIAKTAKGQLIIFIHGSCEGQEESLVKAARLSVFCGCPVLLFDWASPSVRQAGIWAYIQSDRALELSELYFGKLIEQIRNQISPTKITLVAHSMGTKLVRNYLRQYPDCFIDQVHLVRPDISLPVFLLEQNRFQHQVGRMYIYLSDYDLALQSSELLMSAHVERLGRQSDPARWFSQQSSNASKNTFFIDTSSLGRSADATGLKLSLGPDGLESYVSILGHGIPYEAIEFIHSLNTEKPTSSFKIERPYSMNPNYWKLKAAKSS